MLIEIGEDCISVLENKKNLKLFVEILRDITNGRRKGRNLVYAKKNVIDKIIEAENDIGEEIKKVFVKLKASSYEAKSILSKSSEIIRLSNRKGYREIPDKGNTIHEIHYSEFHKKEISLDKECKGISENLNDSKIYEKIAKYYINKKGINNIDIKFDWENGGGNTTKNSLKLNMKKRDKSLCLCIVDSDKNFPSAEKGETAKKLYNYHKNEQDNVIKAINKLEILDVHEIENLIPIPCIKCSLENYENKKDTYTFLEKLLLNTSDSIKYFDFKKGIDVSKSDEEYLKYWEEVLKKLDMDKKTIDKVAKGGIVEKVLEKSEDLSNCELIEKSVFYHKEWMDKGKIIYSWGCSGKNIRVT